MSTPFPLPCPASRLAFISDLHLDSALPHTLARFTEFLRTLPARADALFILGDLFEYWAGDDDAGRGINRAVIAALKQTRDAGVQIYLQHGNRDFLLGQNFAQESGVTLLPETVLLHSAHEPVLLLHGDTLCTDDIAYQTFRTQVRDPHWQQNFLAQPLTQRLAHIDMLRQRSQQEKQTKAMAIMDVNPKAVLRALQEAGCRKMIHGHTHRPATHRWEQDGQHYERWVLSDWEFDHAPTRGNALMVADATWHWEVL
ncbi:MAG: UDP-2,3-diacylglucosamine diphosphatase [Burkholderiaceae bacterium]|nr:MAG: UDP-2,3-diacylglucosamine diphosphatase [Burkholderiaceae bacterium]